MLDAFQAVNTINLKRAARENGAPNRLRPRSLGAAAGALIALAALSLQSSCSRAGASQFVRVYDGDTITIDETRWRLWGVEAPELDQTCRDGTVACGIESRDHLRRLVLGRAVVCVARGRSYDRIVGLCRVGGVDLSAAQVEAGHALDEPRYSHGEYADEQATARSERRGIWAGDFVTPTDWKKGRR